MLTAKLKLKYQKIKNSTSNVKNKSIRFKIE